MSKPSQNVTYPCLTVKQGKHDLVCFVAKAHELWKLVKINLRETDKDIGYQRALSSTRVAAIKRYLEGGDAIPNAVLLSLDPATKISKDGKSITIPRKVDAGWVIDGQHRLAGAKEADSHIEIVVIAFIGISEDEQAKQFVVINREAKGVPTSLYFDLKNRLPPGKTDAEIAKDKSVEISRSLKRDKDSPFHNRIVISSPKKGEISLTNFVRKIHPLLRANGRFGSYTLIEQTRIIDNYFRALWVVFPTEFQASRLTFLMTLGFGAMINALGTVFDLSLKHYSGFTIENAANILSNVAHYDFAAWDTYGTGTKAEVAAGNDFRLDLTRAYESEDGGSTLRL